ncbi:unnamed protein product [Heterobilharzia americana]|nr:unnamed protein product [Heterobilharzia americana]
MTEDLILFRRPRRFIESIPNEHGYVIRKPRKFTVSFNKIHQSSNRPQSTLQDKRDNYTIAYTKPYLLKDYKNIIQRRYKHAITDNQFNFLSIKGNFSLQKANNNDIGNKYSLEICHQLQISNHTEIVHNFQYLKPNTTDSKPVTEINFNENLQKLTIPIKRTPLYHNLIKIAYELQHALVQAGDKEITCSIEKLPGNYQDSSTRYQTNYAIIIKEKMNHSKIMLVDSPRVTTKKLIRFRKNQKLINLSKGTTIKPEQVKLLESYYSGGSLISLEACQLEHLPDLSAFYTTLRSIDLSRNYLKDLPEEFSLLKSLEYLSLRCNPIRKVPSSISKLMNLKSLDLSYCIIEQLNYEFYDLKSLELLNLSHNRLVYIDSRIKQFLHLKILKICGNDLLGIPPGLLYLCQNVLENLDLNDNPLLCLFPKEFKRCSTLKVQSLKLLASLTVRNILHKVSEKNKEALKREPEHYLLMVASKEDTSDSLEFKKVSDKIECTILKSLLSPVGSCCWCGLDRYDDINTICKHCVDIFTYSMVPIRMLCCGIKCMKEANQCSTSEQFAQRYYVNYKTM